MQIPRDPGKAQRCRGKASEGGSYEALVRKAQRRILRDGRRVG